MGNYDLNFVCKNLMKVKILKMTANWGRQMQPEWENDHLSLNEWSPVCKLSFINDHQIKSFVL